MACKSLNRLLRALSDSFWMLCHKRKLDRIIGSDLFDCGHYRAQIGKNGRQFTCRRLLCDYLRRGWRLRRSPGQWLDHATYEASCRSLDEAPSNEGRRLRRRSALEHYVFVGRYKGLATRPFETSLISLPPVRAIPGENRVAVVLHVYYADQWAEMATALEKIGEPADLFISLVGGASDHLSETISGRFPSSFVGVFPNHGRDICPFVHILNSGVLDGYELVLKLHTKRSPHLPSGNLWRRRLISSLLELGPGGRSRAIDLMVEDPKIGILCPQGTLVGKEAWNSCRERTLRLASRAGIQIDDRTFRFVAGTMFWFRPAALQLMRRLALQPMDFEMEAGQLDGAASHAIERLFGEACRTLGFLVRELTPPAPAPANDES